MKFKSKNNLLPTRLTQNGLKMVLLIICLTGFWFSTVFRIDWDLNDQQKINSQIFHIKSKLVLTSRLYLVKWESRLQLRWVTGSNTRRYVNDMNSLLETIVEFGKW